MWPVVLAGDDVVPGPCLRRCTYAPSNAKTAAFVAMLHLCSKLPFCRGNCRYAALVQHSMVRTPEQLGALLRERRNRLGLTQEEVALSAGVHRRVVGDLERGVREARLGNVLAVTTALGLDVQLRARGGVDA